MRRLIFFVLIAVALAEERPMYTTKYDKFDIDSIIKNDRLFKNYIDCLMDEKPCTPEGNEFKRNLPDALETGCASCSKAQKTMAEKFYHHVIDNRIDDWMRLENKYDPRGNYRKNYLGLDIETTTVAL
ncbi:ejaculatory bulb-specific protein 3 [Diachasma alloeum]|uniref:Chemosensory protein 3 n=1 Tax=Diachasma alloeum TaxID=454923 RepID=A0A4E0S1B4_9HYME|nr:ejaculatory bulb-specific protein 3 [Diachasma alloeum]THK33220.1 chemosensory protein 3 [Diachasma alloeum]